MIPEEFKAALKECAVKMTEACGHEVAAEVTQVENQTFDAGIGIETDTTITVIFIYSKIEKIK